MGILDDILLVIPDEGQKDTKNQKNENVPDPPPTDDAKKEPTPGWYGEEFVRTYMQEKKPS